MLEGPDKVLTLGQWCVVEIHECPGLQQCIRSIRLFSCKQKGKTKFSNAQHYGIWRTLPELELFRGFHTVRCLHWQCQKEYDNSWPPEIPSKLTQVRNIVPVDKFLGGRQQQADLYDEGTRVNVAISNKVNPMVYQTLEHSVVLT